MGCSGLMARLAAAGSRIHVLYLAVDGFHHYGVDGETTYAQRLAEIDRVVELFGDRCTHEIAYGDEDLIERLDTLPQRELVDRFEEKIGPFERLPSLCGPGVGQRQGHGAGIVDGPVSLDQPLVGHPLQHRHHRRVGDVATSGQGGVDLADRPPTLVTPLVRRRITRLR